MPQRRKRRHEEALSPKQLEDRALVVLCQGFGWDHQTIFSSWNRRNKNKPYAFKARTYQEWRSNELKMRAARNESPIFDPRSALHLEEAMQDFQPTRKHQSSTKRRRKRKLDSQLENNTKSRWDWEEIIKKGPDPNNPLTKRIEEMREEIRQSQPKRKRKRKSP
jgi:hypothetical protein